jgi:ABC-type nitrate/sulfonate/bicarbonate transport system permease component
MFAALVLLSLTGLALNGGIGWLEHRLLRNSHAGHSR